MHFLISLFFLVHTCDYFSSPGQIGARGANVPAFFLAGDSTTAEQSSHGGGWGHGFLSFLENGAWGINYGANGATTVSYVKNGNWDQVLASGANATRTGYDFFVTLQFGHNDQNARSNISLSEYQSNLEMLAKNIISVGGTPLFLTCLTRRRFSSEHIADDSLHEQRLATIAAGEATGTRVLDLNQASRQYVDAIGYEAAQAYNLNEYDSTHLNSRGSIVFGRMVADLMLGHDPVVKAASMKLRHRRDASPMRFEGWIAPNQTLSSKIWNGLPA